MKFLQKHWGWGVIIGLGLVVGLLRFWPDGKLHMVFCDVGQGDGIYIRYPNGADMLVDGGPGKKVNECLGRFMPFYDRTIDVVILTHPQLDHFGGLTDVLERYTVKHFVTVPVKQTTESYQKLVQALIQENTDFKYLAQGDEIVIGDTKLNVLWPDKSWLEAQVLGATTEKEQNIFSLYLKLSYKKFDVLLTGDGDQALQTIMESLGEFSLLPENVEILKVPHHGSKTGMTEDFLERISPDLAVIQVGKNSYGHPNSEVIEQLKKHGKVLRNDKDGDIEVISDGLSWELK